MRGLCSNAWWVSSPNNFFGLIIWRNNSTSYVKYMLDLRSTSLHKCLRICYISVNLCCFPGRHPEDPEGVHCAALYLPPWQPCQLSQGILPKARKGEYTWLLVSTVEECEWRVQFSKPKKLPITIPVSTWERRVSLTRQPIAVSDISIYICLIDIRSKSKEQLNERRAGLSKFIPIGQEQYPLVISNV